MVPKTSPEFAPSFALGYVSWTIEKIWMPMYRSLTWTLPAEYNVLEAPLLIFFSKNVHFFSISRRHQRSCKSTFSSARYFLLLLLQCYRLIDKTTCSWYTCTCNTHARTHTHQKYGKIREDSEITTDTCHSLSRVPRFSYLVSDKPCFFFFPFFNFCPPNCSRFATGVNKRSQDSHTNRWTFGLV